MKEVQQTREKRETYRKANVKNGEYKPFSLIFQGQGGHDDKFAMQAAKNICSNCLDLGGDWTRFNSFSGRLEFLDMRHGYKEEMEEAWSLWERRSESRTDTAAGAATGSTEAPASTPPRERPRALPTGPKGSGELKPKSSLDIAFNRDAALNEEHATVMATASGLMAHQGSSGWDWAATLQDQLAASIRGLQGNQSEFAKVFLAMNAKDIKHQYRDDLAKLETLIKDCCDQMSVDLGRVSQHCKEIQALHQALMMARKPATMKKAAKK